MSLLCLVVRCSTLWRGAVRSRVAVRCYALLCVAMRCIAVRCIAVRCIAVHCGALRCVMVCCRALQCIAVRCSALQCVAVRCSALQCVAVSMKLVHRRCAHINASCRAYESVQGGEDEQALSSLKGEAFCGKEPYFGRDLLQKSPAKGSG